MPVNAAKESSQARSVKYIGFFNNVIAATMVMILAGLVSRPKYQAMSERKVTSPARSMLGDKPVIPIKQIVSSADNRKAENLETFLPSFLAKPVRVARWAPEATMMCVSPTVLNAS